MKSFKIQTNKPLFKTNLKNLVYKAKLIVYLPIVLFIALMVVIMLNPHASLSSNIDFVKQNTYEYLKSNANHHEIALHSFLQTFNLNDKTLGEKRHGVGGFKG